MSPKLEDELVGLTGRAPCGCPLPWLNANVALPGRSRILAHHAEKADEHASPKAGRYRHVLDDAGDWHEVPLPPIIEAAVP